MNAKTAKTAKTAQTKIQRHKISKKQIETNSQNDILLDKINNGKLTENDLYNNVYLVHAFMDWSTYYNPKFSDYIIIDENKNIFKYKKDIGKYYHAAWGSLVSSVNDSIWDTDDYAFITTLKCQKGRILQISVGDTVIKDYFGFEPNNSFLVLNMLKFTKYPDYKEFLEKCSKAGIQIIKYYKEYHKPEYIKQLIFQIQKNNKVHDNIVTINDSLEKQIKFNNYYYNFGLMIKYSYGNNQITFPIIKKFNDKQQIINALSIFVKTKKAAIVMNSLSFFLELESFYIKIFINSNIHNAEKNIKKNKNKLLMLYKFNDIFILKYALLLHNILIKKNTIDENGKIVNCNSLRNTINSISSLKSSFKCLKYRPKIDTLNNIPYLYKEYDYDYLRMFSYKNKYYSLHDSFFSKDIINLFRNHKGFDKDVELPDSIVSSIQLLYYFPETQKQLTDEKINKIVNYKDNIFTRKIFKLNPEILDDFKNKIKQIPKLADKFLF